MQAPDPCSFLEQLLSCDTPKETDFSSILKSSLPSFGLTPWYLRDWSSSNRVSDHKKDSKTNPCDWESLELSPLVHAFLPNWMEDTESEIETESDPEEEPVSETNSEPETESEIETEPVSETESVSEKEEKEDTKESSHSSLKSSFDMNSSTSIWNNTNHSNANPEEHSRFHSSFQSMMENHQDEDQILEQHQEYKTTQKNSLISSSTMSKMDLLFGNSSLGLSESFMYHSNTLKSPWSLSQCPSKLWDPSKAQSQFGDPSKAPSNLWDPSRAQSKFWDTPKAQSEFWDTPKAQSNLWDTSKAQYRFWETTPESDYQFWNPS